MLTTAFVAAAISSATPGKIAFASREYYPYPDKRVSYSRLRICNWDGSGVRVISPPGHHVTAIRWLSKTRLIYKASLERYSVEGNAHYTIDIRSKKWKVLAGPDYMVSDEDGLDGVYLYKSGKHFRVTATGALVPTALPKPIWVDPLRIQEKSEVVSQDPKAPGKFAHDGEDRFILTGPNSKVVPQRYFNRGYWFSETNQLFLNENYSRGIDRLFKVDWAKTKVQFLCEYGFDIHWRGDHAKYAFITPQDFFEYGPTKMLYCSELWVGDHVLGVTKPIRKGEMQFFAVALQP